MVVLSCVRGGSRFVLTCILNAQSRVRNHYIQLKI
jgi:hypothetical protein